MSLLTEPGTEGAEQHRFAVTHWSVVLSAGDPQSPGATQAREKLCRVYWPPLYNFVRRQGYNSEDAQDLTQAFFAKSFEKDFFGRANPEKGRFRSFLLTALHQFVLDQRERARTAKRGGGAPLISLDQTAVEEKFLASTGADVPGDQLFDRRWAMAILDAARARLREECIAFGKARLFEQLDLPGKSRDKAMTYADLAARDGQTVSAVKSAVSRLRQRYGELVREEIAQTVADPADVDSEIRYLLTVIGS
jgi:DNA-directed RNA polymerase specialized sigma24 family protein